MRKARAAQGGVVGGVSFLICDLVVEAGFLNAPEADLTPAGDGHGFDQGPFDGRFGLEFRHEFV